MKDLGETELHGRTENIFWGGGEDFLFKVLENQRCHNEQRFTMGLIVVNLSGQ